MTAIINSLRRQSAIETVQDPLEVRWGFNPTQRDKLLTARDCGIAKVPFAKWFPIETFDTPRENHTIDDYKPREIMATIFAAEAQSLVEQSLAGTGAQNKTNWGLQIAFRGELSPGKMEAISQATMPTLSTIRQIAADLEMPSPITDVCEGEDEFDFGQRETCVTCWAKWLISPVCAAYLAQVAETGYEVPIEDPDTGVVKDQLFRPSLAELEEARKLTITGLRIGIESLQKQWREIANDLNKTGGDTDGGRKGLSASEEILRKDLHAGKPEDKQAKQNQDLAKILLQSQAQNGAAAANGMSPELVAALVQSSLATQAAVGKLLENQSAGTAGTAEQTETFGAKMARAKAAKKKKPIRRVIKMAIKGTIIELPKGTKVLEAGGGFEQGGTTLRLTEPAKAEFDRNLTDDEIAGYFVAADRTELLPILDGTFTLHGLRVEDGEIQSPDGNTVIDAPEQSRLLRQQTEDVRLADAQKEIDLANKRASADARERDEYQNRQRLLESESSAADKAIAINRDLRAKAAAADYSTVRDDIERATMEGKTDLETAERRRGLDTPSDLKTAPDKTEIDRENAGVARIGAENVAVAKADYDAFDFNNVTHKDGTNKDITPGDDPDNKEAVEVVDEKTDLTLKQAAPDKKATDKDRVATGDALATVEENAEQLADGRREHDVLRREAAAAPPEVAPQIENLDADRSEAQAEMIADSKIAIAKEEEAKIKEANAAVKKAQADFETKTKDELAAKAEAEKELAAEVEAKKQVSETDAKAKATAKPAAKKSK